MSNKQVNAQCDSCESLYSVIFATEVSSEETPEYCPFCGEKIEMYDEESMDEETDDYSDEEWD